MKHLPGCLFNSILKLPVAYILYFLLLLFSLSSCSYERGVIVKTDGIEKNGYIRFNECCDRKNIIEDNTVEFKESKIASLQKYNLKDINTITRGRDTFIYIDSKKIKDDYGLSMYIPAKLIIHGNISVYRYCSIRYMNTMFSSNRMDLYIYLLQKKGEDIFYVIPHDVEQFKIFSAEHFSLCPEIVNDINKSKFLKKIENPIPGNITDYEFVGVDDITDFVNRYNECVKKI